MPSPPSTRRCRSPAARRADAVLATAAIVRFGFGLAEGDGLLAMLTEPLERLALDEPQRVDLLCAAMHQMALTGSVAGAARLLAQAEAVVRGPAHGPGAGPRASRVRRAGRRAGRCPRRRARGRRRGAVRRRRVG